ncbi:hypothetical protein B0H12DRAFT_1132621 [Mycena haematopus]|nr:hypothetical protein B0H12DRAFT_1132621 [Mycena haematopus]
MLNSARRTFSPSFDSWRMNECLTGVPPHQKLGGKRRVSGVESYQGSCVIQSRAFTHDAYFGTIANQLPERSEDICRKCPRKLSKKTELNAAGRNRTSEHSPRGIGNMNPTASMDDETAEIGEKGRGVDQSSG